MQWYSFLVIVALALAAASTILGNLAANLIEKYTWGNRKAKRMDVKRRVFVIIVLWLLTAVPLFYIQYRQMSQPVAALSGPQASPSPTLKGRCQVVEVERGKTVELFDGGLFITVNEAEYSQVTATIGVPGLDNIKMEKAPVGQAVICGETGKRYEVRVAEAGAVVGWWGFLGAKFTVTRLG